MALSSLIVTAPSSASPEAAAIAAAHTVLKNYFPANAASLDYAWASTNPTVDCQWTLAEDFDDGKGSDVIIAQVFYKWPTLVNLPWFSLANLAGNNRLLSAVRVFKNEPF